MSSIDDRIVQMQFNNDQFERGVRQTNDSLGTLKDRLKLTGATDGLNNIQKTADSFNLGNIATGVDRISSAFSVLGIVGINILSRLTQDAISFGANLINKVLDPIVQGGTKRALALEQAKFQFKGLGLDIEATMGAALGAVKGTAFGLDDAATAAAQFGASGITAGNGLQESLRAIAGVAAQTGSAYGDVARTFESVAGNGRLMGQDLLSLSSRGVNAAAVLAKSMGISETAVREMVTAGDISFKQFSDAMNAAFGDNAVNANQTYAGSLANVRAALARVGADFETPKFEAIRKIFNATAPVIDALHASLLPLQVALGQLMNVNSDRLVAAISKINFANLTSTMPQLMAAFTAIVKAITSIVEPLRAAFVHIFPPATAEQLQRISFMIKDFSESLILTAEQGQKLQTTFAGFFAIIHIGWMILSGLVGVFMNLIGFANTGNGSILSFTSTIGLFFVKLDRVIRTGDGLNQFFNGLENVLKTPIALFRLFAEGVQFLFEAIENLVTKRSIETFANDTKSRFAGLIQVGEFFQKVFAGIKRVLEAVLTVISPILRAVEEAAKTIGKKIGDALGAMTFDQGIKAINTGLFAGFLFILNGFFGNIQGALQGNGVAFVTKFKLIFGQLQLNLKALEMNLNAKTILTIASAVALLAVSAVALSMVDPIKLGAAMGAMTIMFGQLLIAFALISKIPTSKGFLTIPVITSAMIMLAIAMNIMALAVAQLSKLDWNELAKGLTGVVVMMGTLVAAAALLGKSGPRTMLGAASLVVMAAAINILVKAVTELAGMSWEDLARGLVGLTLSMVLLVQFTKTIGNPLKIIPTAVAMLLLAGALKILADATAEFANLSWENLGKGIAGMAAALIVIGFSLKKLPANLLVSGAGLILVAVAIQLIAQSIKMLGELSPETLGKSLATISSAILVLVVAMNQMTGTLVGAAALVVAAASLLVLARAMKEMGALSWDEIGRGLTALGGSLLILVAAMLIMGDPIVLLGAAALIIAAAALMMLAPALAILGTMSWDAIGRGLTVLGAGITILAAGGVLLIPAIVGLMGLGFAVTLLGVGLLAAGVGIGLFAAGLVVLSGVGTAALALIGPAIQQFAEQIPLIAQQIGVGVGKIAEEVAKQGPAITGAITTVLLSIIASIVAVIPPLIDAAVLLVTKLVEAIVVLLPLLVDAGLRMIIGILNGVANNIGLVVEKGTDVIVNFIGGIGNAIPRLLNAGADLIIRFVNGLAETIRSRRGELERAGINLADAISGGMASGLRNSVGTVINAARNLANAIPAAIRKMLGIASPSKVTTFLGEYSGVGLANGMDNTVKIVEDSAANLGDSALNAMQNSLSGLSDAISGNIDIQPSIRPVLDLSAIKKDSSLISGMLGNQSLSLDSVKANARAASIGYESNLRVATDADGQMTGTPGTTINLTQNNTSPKALSSAEIYRQTKNQLSVTKGELDK